jgi:hypothetical protein
MVTRKPVPGTTQPPNISITSPSHHANNPWAHNDNPPYPVSPAPARAPPAVPIAAQNKADYFELEADTKAPAEEAEEKDWWDESDDEDDLEAHQPLQPERKGQNQAAGQGYAQSGTGPGPTAPEHNPPNALRVGHAPATQSTSPRTSEGFKDTGFAELSLQDTRPQPAQDYQTYTRFGQPAASNANSVALENPAGEWAETKLATNVSAGPPPYPLPPPPLTPQLSQSPAIGTPIGQTPLKRTQSSNQPPLIPVLPEDPWEDQATIISNPKAVSAQAFSAASQAAVDPWAAPPAQSSHNVTPNKPPKLNVVAPPLPDRSSSSAETPQVERRKRNEFYEIKNIRWRDGQQLRQSPILVQNANGPCPLLALVNALVLTTPPNGNTALIEALSYKEQVSLGLLLDAVFDELTSGRRGNDLPDIGDLYSFLITLHTGMNVNPRFVDAGEEAQSEAPKHPGTFEETKEMRLYSTFNIPLIHGWIPDPSDSAYSAFHRQKVAQTYDDAQNMQFHAEELEAKFHAEGLSEEEQDIFTDVIAIKEFLTTYPTQLSEYGLEVFKQCIEPGQVVILFRNDHFSTLYKQPGTGRLLVLVTDAGYSTHDEIVWESLADVNGMNAELFSGDFRSVSNTTGGGSTSYGNNNEWQTVTGKNARRQLGEANDSGNAYNNASSSNQHNSSGNAVEALTQAQIAEQEDHDLALALQLQEEEEANQRSMSADRAREVEASEHYLSQHPSQRPAAAPAAMQSSTSVRQPSQQEQPPTQPRRPNRVPVGGVSRAHNADDLGEDAAPPPYEPVQRTKPTLQTPQRPPNSVAAGQGSYTVPRRQSSNSYGNNSPGMGYMPQSPAGSMPQRRRLQSQTSVGGAPLQQGASGRPGGQGQTEERCAIM